ncbi:MAG: hypothetical protein ACTJGR_01955 [Pauljensenia sp.]
MSEEGTDVFGIRGRAASTPTDPSASDPLVAAPIDTATPFSGTRLLEDGAQLTTAITEGDWVSGSLAVFASGADLIAAALDPIGTAISMGVGWLLDHVDPLKSWLNELTGDAGAVAGGAATWAKVSAALQASADALMRSLDSTLSTQQAETIRAYEQLQREHANHLSMASGLAGGISTGLTVASTLVQVVHDLVRDAIGDIVGKFASAALQEVLTLGLATPKIISDIVATVNKWVNRLGSKVDDLLRSFDNLSDLMKRVDRLLDRLRGVMDKLTAPSRRLTEIAERSGHVTGKWLTPKYSDRLLRRLPSAKEEAIRLLDGDAARTFFSDELGTKPWTVDDLLEKMQLRADDPLLTPVDKRGLAYIRENIAAVDEGTVLSKLDLVQKSEPGTYPDIQGYVARAQDHVGLDAASKFEAVRGDYATSIDAAGIVSARNAYDPAAPLFETRVEADADLAARTRVPYSSDMLDSRGDPIPASATPVSGNTAAENRHDPAGPYTGTGFPSSRNGAVVPEHKVVGSGTGTPDPVRYQETYDANTGRRLSIVVEHPLEPGRPIRLPTPW